MSRWPAWFASTLMLLACACGDAPAAAPGRLVRVPLLPAPDAEPFPADRIVFSEDVGADPSPWAGEAPEVRTLAQGAGVRWLRLRSPGGRDEMRAVRRGPLSAGPFDLLAVMASIGASGTLVAELERDGRVIASSPSRSLLARGDPVRLALPLVHDGSPVDALVLRFSGSSRKVDLGRVELLRRAPLGWLPGGDEAGAVVVSGSEARVALGVGTGRPLVGRFDAPVGGRLRFAWALPEPLRAADDAELELELSADGLPSLTRRVALSAGESRRWQLVEVTLGALAGAVLDLRLSVVAASPTACAISPPVAWTPALRPASVLLVTTDTHRGDHLGAARGGVVVETPNLDALAAQGVFFERCFSSTNVTNPSHVALMTGVHPRDTGILVNNVPLAEAAPTLAEVFASHGYVTVASLSARHLGHAGSGLGQGFDRMTWPADGEASAEEAIARLREALEEAEGQPVFAWLHLFDPHHPYAPDPADLRPYWPEDRDPRDPSLPPLPIDDDVLPDDMAGLRDLDHPRAAYRAEITAMDRTLGRLLADSRFDDKAVIAVVGDHGESLGAHGVYFTHAELYPDSLHVPLILRGPLPVVDPAVDPEMPGFVPGSRRSEPVTSLDVGRTVLDLAGLEAAPFPGRSLVSVRDERPRFAVSAHGFSASVTFQDLHLVLHLRDHHQRFLAEGVERHRVQLFDLASDPGALRDLILERPEVARALGERLVEWLRDARALEWAGASSTDAELEATLLAMGYVAGTGTESATLFEPDDCDWCERFR